MLGASMPKSRSYEEFVDKFKSEKTTGDCYTPPEVYDAVLARVRDEYGVGDGVPIVCPFWLGADCERVEYPVGCVVVDNPPFSILAKIIRFYQAHGVRFFPVRSCIDSVFRDASWCDVHCGGFECDVCE